jgi:hypothetical protein
MNTIIGMPIIRRTLPSGRLRCQVLEWYQGYHAQQCIREAHHTDAFTQDLSLCNVHVHLSHRFIDAHDNGQISPPENRPNRPNHALNHERDRRVRRSYSSHRHRRSSGTVIHGSPSHESKASNSDESGSSLRSGSVALRMSLDAELGDNMMEEHPSDGESGEEPSSDDMLQIYAGELEPNYREELIQNNEHRIPTLYEISTCIADEWYCSICMEDAVNIHELNICEHRMCSNCLKRILSSSLFNRFRCPHCRRWILNTPEPVGPEPDENITETEEGGWSQLVPTVNQSRPMAVQEESNTIEPRGNHRRVFAVGSRRGPRRRRG